MRRWVWLNALSLTMFGAFFVFVVLQSVFGWHAANHELTEHGVAATSYPSYLISGDFVESVFENWESEFLQMGSYVLLTAYLLQKGSPESAPLEGSGDDPTDAGQIRPDSPWPVHRGGLALGIYNHSLTIALFGLFGLSFVLHLLGGTAAYNDAQALHHQPPIGPIRFLGSSEFWFQSMQNWQSEFLAVLSIVTLSIFLRQYGSPESKPVHAPHDATGND